MLRSKRNMMKLLLCAIALLAGVTRVDASNLKLVGDLSYEITEPRLTFKLDGAVQNLSPAGSTSGTIKLVLWASKSAYPAPAALIGDYTLGQISSGYQFSDFTVKTIVDIPALTGDYQFTIGVLEYTAAGWRTQLVVRTGIRKLIVGDFADQLKWTIPKNSLVSPPTQLALGKVIVLSERATSLLNLFPNSSRTKTTLTIKASGKVVASNSVGQNTAKFIYTTRTNSLSGKQVPSAMLALNFPQSTWKTTLFFYTANSGVYKNVATTGDEKDATWGVFTFQ